MLFSGLFYRILFFAFIQFLFQPVWNQDYENSDLLNAYDIKFYFLDLKINNTSINFEGNVKILAELVNPDVDSVAVELIQEITLDSVWLDGEKTNFTHSNDVICMAIPSDFVKGELFQMTFFYKLQDVETDKRLGIFNRQYNNQFLVTYTLSEPYYSKTWFPCKQVLSDKADSIYIFLTMADSLMAGANGLLTNISYLENNEKRYEWKSYYPVAYYLLSFAVANYMDYSFMASTADGDSVLIQNYIYNDSLYFQENKILYLLHLCLMVFLVLSLLYLLLHQTKGPYYLCQ
jgi:aminopeptidase N